MLVNKLFILLLIIGLCYFLYKIYGKVREGVVFTRGYIYKGYKRNQVDIDIKKEELTQNGKKISLKNNLNNIDAGKICNNKELTTRILRQNSIPTANNYKWNRNIDKTENIKIIENILYYPLVVKPITGEKGYGVTANIENRKDLLQAINKLKYNKSGILIEQHLHGKEYRIMILNNEIVGITEREDPYIVGDGRKNVLELITDFNKNKGKSFKCHNINKKLIKKQGYAMNNIVKTEQKIVISNISNMSNGGGIKKIEFNDVHPDNLIMFKKAATVIGITLTGIDFITPTLRIPYYNLEGECGILELNPEPGLEVHYYTIEKVNKTSFVDRFINLIFK